MTAKRCQRCNRIILNKKAIALGMGPVCAAKMEKDPKQMDFDELKKPSGSDLSFWMGSAPFRRYKMRQIVCDEATAIRLLVSAGATEEQAKAMLAEIPKEENDSN